MSKLPWDKWNYDHWERDMAIHPPEIAGWWSFVLCYLHRSETRGTLTMDMEGWRRIIRATPDQTQQFVDYLKSHKIADVTLRHCEVTITNRRMDREEKAKEAARLRKQKSRATKDGHSEVTGEKKEERRKKKEIRQEEGGGGRDFFISIPLKDGTEFGVTTSMVSGWVDTYPGLGKAGVEQCLRDAKDWCIRNPGKRKTRRGAMNFLGGWLQRDHKELIEKQGSGRQRPLGNQNGWGNELR